MGDFSNYKKFENVGIRSSNDTLIVMDSTNNNISLHSSDGGGDNVDTLSIKNIINKTPNMDLNLSSLNGTTINPVITINNNNQDCRINTNLNISGNVNITDGGMIKTTGIGSFGSITTGSITATGNSSFNSITTGSINSGNNSITTSGGIINSGGEILVSGGNLQLNDNRNLSFGTNDDTIIKNDGSNFLIQNTTSGGNITIDNQDADKKIIMKLGDTSNATSFEVQNSSGVAKLYVNGSGYIGIGNTNPSYKLDVSGAVNASNFYGNISGGYVTSAVSNATRAENLGGYYPHTGNAPNYIVRRDGSGNFSAGTITANTFSANTFSASQVIQFSINSTPKMKIYGGVNPATEYYDENQFSYVRTGFSTSLPTGFGSFSNKTIPFLGGTKKYWFGGHAPTLPYDAWFFAANENGILLSSSGNGDQALRYVDEDSGGFGSVNDMTGWHITPSGSLSSNSDIRIKRDINTYKNSDFEKYKKIRTVTYKQKFPEKIKPEKYNTKSFIDKYNNIHYGLIAQEIYSLYPEIENTGEIRIRQEWEYIRDNWELGEYDKALEKWNENKIIFEAENKNEEYKVPKPAKIFNEKEPLKSLEYNRLHIITIGVVQDLIKKNELLQTEVATLKSIIDKLKTSNSFEEFKQTL